MSKSVAVSISRESASMQDLIELIRKQSNLIESLQKIIEGLNLKLERFECASNDVKKDVNKDVADDVDKVVTKVVNKDLAKDVAIDVTKISRSDYEKAKNANITEEEAVQYLAEQNVYLE